uniref:Ig-like domain-containing protein n=1 Tax=Gasterosteus aculeatus aculeatus TaxID=481459 RepID=A0AAQ4NP13_GASAC
MGHTLFGALGLFSLNILLYCGHAQDVPRPVLTVSPSWTSPGDSVTLTCSVGPPSAGWRFFWYKAVPQLSDYYPYYTYELLAGGTTGTEQDSYILHGQTHTAGYQCRAGRGDPVFYTQYSGVKFVWSGGVNPAASLTVSPHRLQHFSTESLSLICEGNSTEWRVMKVDEDGYVSSCYNWGEMTGSTCNTDTRASSGVYWCESVTQSSNAANITIHNVPRPVLTVSPSWTSPGDSVTLTCSVGPPSAGWRFFWYKAVPDLSRYYTPELLAGGTTGTEQDSYILHGQTHTAGYACRAGRGDPGFNTSYSRVKFVWSGGVNPAASLTVTPHRLQHFSTESLSLICEGNSAEWIVKKADEDGYVSSSCSYWGEMTGSTCNTTTASSGVYWCESETQFSNAANITIHSGDVILVSSVHPVTEGHSVTLGCKFKTENLLYNVDFYKNNTLIPNPVRGELLISAVTKSDEGFYKCRGRKSPQGLETLTSAESWLSVKCEYEFCNMCYSLSE